MTFKEFIQLREGGLLSTNGCPPVGDKTNPYFTCPGSGGSGGGSIGGGGATSALAQTQQPPRKMKKMNKK